MTNRNSVDKEDANYHVYNRGVNKQKIFIEDDDRWYFVSLCSRSTLKFKANFHAMCLMGNHYHLIIHTEKANLSKLMKFIGESYSKYFLKKYSVEKKVGHTFQGPYGRKVICDDEYFSKLLDYIHLNPVKDGFVTRARDYFWSSYSDYSDDAKRFTFLDVKSHFDKFTRLEEDDYNSCNEWKPELYTYSSEKYKPKLSSGTICDLKYLVNDLDLDIKTQKMIIAYSLHEWGKMSSSEIAQEFDLTANQVRKFKFEAKTKLEIRGSLVSNILLKVKHSGLF